MKKPLLLLPLLFLGCSVFSQSSKSIVADSAAERIWQEDRYERLCVQVKGPATCLQMQKLLNELKHENEIANEVQKYGKLPAPEEDRIKSLINQIRKLP